jgi:uncharacterized membrane protein
METLGVGDRIICGINSAIYALVRTANPDLLADQFRGYGGTVLSTTLSRDQQAKVEKILGNKAA